MSWSPCVQELMKHLWLINILLYLWSNKSSEIISSIVVFNFLLNIYLCCQNQNCVHAVSEKCNPPFLQEPTSGVHILGLVLVFVLSVNVWLRFIRIFEKVYFINIGARVFHFLNPTFSPSHIFVVFFLSTKRRSCILFKILLFAFSFWKVVSLFNFVLVILTSTLKCNLFWNKELKKIF